MEITNLSIDEVECFNNETTSGVIISWSANIGFGQLTIYKDGEKWKADTECMCSKEDKEFIHMVMNKWIDDMIIE